VKTHDFLWIMDYGLWIMDYGLWIMDYGLWIMDYGFKMSIFICFQIIDSALFEIHNPKS